MKPNDELRDFIMLVGLPGSGKSTYGDKTFFTHSLISSDAVLERYAELLNASYADIFVHYIELAQKFVKKAIKTESQNLSDIVLDQTNLTKAARIGKLNLLENKDKYWKVAIYMDTPRDLINFRLAKRNLSGKMISDELLDKMEESFEMPTVDEGFDEVLVISV